jgi:hypothetical protein
VRLFGWARKASWNLLIGLPGRQVVAVAVAEERAADPLHEAREAGPVARLHPLVHLRHQARAGIGAELFQRGELGEQGLRVTAEAARPLRVRARERLGDAIQGPPAVDPPFRAAKNSFRLRVRVSSIAGRLIVNYEFDLF